ncbi:unnamed protein product [Penicillium olsonii]|nr:unnamed protein product [Penicillium olsonii]
MPIVLLPSDDPLISAAQDGQIATIEKALDDGKYADSRDLSNGRTLLIWAAMNGHKPLVELLLQRNASVNAKDIQNGTALLQAIANKHIETSEVLLEAGAHVESRDYCGHTPLTLAAAVGSNTTVKSLLAAGAEIEAKDWRQSRTALSWAAEQGHEDIVEMLLESNAIVDAVDEQSRPPIIWAAMNGHAKCVKLCLRWNASTEIKDTKFDRTPFLWAIKQEHEAVIQVLKGISPPEIDYGLPLHPEPPSSARLDELQQLFRNINPDFDWRKNGGGELLLWTLEDDREEDFKFLLAQGANTNAKDKDGKTALANAAYHGQSDVVKLLLEQGIDADPVDGFNRTPLSWAAEMGHVEIIRLLLEKNVNLDTMDDDESTPLLCAASQGHEAVVSLLIDAGANPCAEDENSRNALSFAAESENMSLVALLLAKGVSPDEGSEYSALSEAVSANNRELVEMLLAHGADPYSESYGHVELPPLVLAACHGKTELVEIFLDRPAKSPEVKKEQICRALVEASDEDKNDVVEVILEQVSSHGIQKGDIDDMVLEYAQRNEDDDLVDLLRPYFSDFEMSSDSDSDSE